MSLDPSIEQAPDEKKKWGKDVDNPREIAIVKNTIGFTGDPQLMLQLILKVINLFLTLL